MKTNSLSSKTAANIKNIIQIASEIFWKFAHIFSYQTMIELKFSVCTYKLFLMIQFAAHSISRERMNWNIFNCWYFLQFELVLAGMGPSQVLHYRDLKTVQIQSDDIINMQSASSSLSTGIDNNRLQAWNVQLISTRLLLVSWQGREERGHPGLSAGHDLSEYCHMLTTLISRPATLAGVYTPTHNKNMKISRGETGGGSGGQFGKFHFSGMTGQFWSFSKINLIRNEVGVEVLFRSNVYYHCKLTRKIFHL